MFLILFVRLYKPGKYRGKQRYGYNKVELFFYDDSRERPALMEVAASYQVAPRQDDAFKESCVAYMVRFKNKATWIRLSVHLVYDIPYTKEMNDSSPDTGEYYWMPVRRSDCKFGCTGPMLIGSKQDFILGGKKANELYLAIDEPTHHILVDKEISVTPTFRLLLCAYDDHNQSLARTITNSFSVAYPNILPAGRDVPSLRVRFNFHSI